MDSTARRTWLLVRENPVLLGLPLLGADAVNFVFGKTNEYVQGRFLPLPHVHALRAAGPAGLSAVGSEFATAMLRLALNFCVQIFGYGLRAGAYVLTVLVVMQLVREGRAALGDAFERMRQVPGLVGALLRFGVTVLLIGLGVGLAAIVPLTAILISTGGIHRVAGAPLISKWILAAVLIPTAGFFAYLAAPYFLELVLKVQGRSFESDFAKRQMMMSTRKYAVAAICVSVALGFLVIGIRARLGFGPGLGSVWVQDVLAFAASLITTLPAIPFVVAVALLTEEPVAEAVPWVGTYPVAD